MKLSILPARDGDCIVLTYGSAPRRHVVIDGGRGEGAIDRLRGILAGCAADGDVFELLVVTHFDADHIEGVQHLLRGEPTFAPLDVWFNGFDQVRRLPGDDVQRMNEAHADALSSRLSELGWPVNRAFDGGAACLSTTNAPLHLMLGGGLEVTLLSPDVRHLESLGRQWEEIRRSIEKPPIDDPDIQRMGKRRREIPERLDVEQLASSRSSIDRDVANGSSIAFLASFEGRSVLLAADAHPDLLRRSIESLIPSGSDRLLVDLMKVSHHGSGGNTTGHLIEVLDVTRFVISTDGSRHQHPNPEAIARLLAHSPVRGRVLYFNYDQDWTSLWNGAELRERYQYECVFPDDPGFLVVDV